MALQEKVLANVRRHKLLESGQKVVVAVSGGIDSMALASLFCDLRQQLDIQLHVATLNHGIRGEDAKDDASFVAGHARGWRLPYTVGFTDAPQLAKQEQIGLEEAGRLARYRFLARVAKTTNADCVAVGHHALDQAETILMRIIRGSGLAGLRGMQFFSPMPGYPDVKLIRPLLNISRADLEQYITAQDLPFRHDESNDDTALQRNFIRHQLLLPLLDRQPNLLTSFARLVESTAIDDEFLATRFERDVLPQVTVRSDSWRMEKARFDSLHSAMKRRFLRTAFERLTSGGAVLDHDRSAEAVAFCQQRVVGRRRDLGAGIQLRIGYDSVTIERQGAEALDGGYSLVPRDTEARLTAPTVLPVGDNRVEIRLGRQSTTGGVTIALRADVNLLLRTRRAGDRFRPKGMNGQSRKLKDWMIDRKIPRAFRERIPLLCADGDVIAICCHATWHLADLSRIDGGGGDVVTVILR